MLFLVQFAFAGGVADCPKTYTTPDLLDAADSADAHFVSLDAAGFSASRAALEQRLACTTDTLDGSTMGRIHRVEALGAFIDGRPERVPQALAGLISADPGHQLPADLVPLGHPVRAALAPASALLRDDTGVPMPKLTSGWIEVDVAPKSAAPGNRAAVLQQIDNQGAVVASHYRWPDESGFAWVVVQKGPSAATATSASVPTTNIAEHVDHTPSRWAHRAPLLGAAVASLATSGALFVIASQKHSEFDGQPIMAADATDQERADYRASLEAMQSNASALSWGWIATGGAGLALGAVAVITW